jgi:hypothetical protein
MALEVVQIIEDINAAEPAWNILGFIDDFRGEQGDFNPSVGGYRILGTRKLIRDFDASVFWAVAVSSPKGKKAICESLKDYSLKYAVLIHPAAKISKNVTIAKGRLSITDASSPQTPFWGRTSI